MKIIRKMYL